MPEVTRRRLLGTAAASAGGAFAASLLPPNLRKALAAGPQRGSLRDVEHVVIHMQENRSFDHYFGTLAGVRGFGDPNVLIQDNSLPTNGKSVFYQYDPDNTAGGSYLLPWHLDTQATSSQAIPSTSHAWTVQHSAVDIVTQNGQNVSLNDNWLPAHLTADGTAHGPYTMSYYEREDIPFHFALAESFTLCDGYHCSLLGPTWPNRMYLMTGMIDPLGTGGGPIISNVVPSPTTGKPYTWKTYPEALTEAGISWRIYQEEDDYGTNMMEFFQAFQDATPGSPLYGGLTIHPPDRFEWDARNGKLPTVSWIIPTSGQSEHPAYLPAAGADFLASKLDAVASNRELWSKTVYIINYDENDGLFDHVPPPLPPPGTEAEFVDGVPIGGGVRVPAFIVSPWSIGGYVATESFDHTSVLQFLESLTGVRAENITDWRRQTFGDLTSALGFSNGKPTTFPQLPPTLPEFWRAENEVATLPAATVPTTNQTPPVQETSRPKLPWRPQSRARITRSVRDRALRATASRVEENRTTHRSDFVNGASDKVYMARVAAVEGRAIDAPSGTVLAYVPGIVGGNVSIFNTSTFSLVSAVASGMTNPYGVAATPDGTTVLVTESGTNTVSVIPTGGSAPNKISGAIVVGIYPHGVVISPDGSTAYVANTGPNTGPGGSQTVSVIDIGSSSVSGELTVGEAPQVLSLSADGSRLMVACANGVYAVRLPGGDVRRARVDLRNPHGVTVSPDGSVAYVADSEQDRVVVLDAGSLRAIRAIGVGRTPWNTAFTADGSQAYVTNANDNTVSVIDVSRSRVADVIALGSNSTSGQINQIPTAIALSPDGHVWVTCNASSSLAVIDTSSNDVIESIDIGLGDVPTGLAFVTVS
jgi:phospholipase C